MSNYERHTIIGYVGGDVSMRYTESGVAVASFSMAINDRFKKGAPPTWYRVTCWRQLAEFANKYVRKGAQMMVVSDRLTLSEWQTNAGERRTTLELTARDVVLLGRKGEAESNADGEDEEFPL